jgi:hypothetical protein
MPKIPPRGFFTRAEKKGTKRAALQEKLSNLSIYKKAGDELVFKDEKNVRQKASELHSVARSLGITIATRCEPGIVRVYLLSDKRKKRRKKHLARRRRNVTEGAAGGPSAW